MKLHELSPVPGSNQKAYRKGRGNGSGNGKTAGRTKKLTVRASAFSASAKAKIEEAGGKAEVV